MKNMIQVFAGFFCDAKLKISLRMLLFTDMPVTVTPFPEISVIKNTFQTENHLI